MKGILVEKVRTLALIGHGGCGKTSLVDAMMCVSGANDRHGRVDAGSSIGDTSDEERERKVSIQSHPLHLGWREHSVFAVDTPGYADFIGDVVCALRVADAAVVVVDSLSGVDVGTLRVWKLADQHALPRAVFINKLDKENADYAKCLEAVRSNFGARCIPVVLPIGRQAGLKGVAEILSGKGMDALDAEVKALAAGLREKLTEAAAETDDALTEKYLEKGALAPRRLRTRSGRR
jgi:elongation factor G